jgi:hypothetical protein
MEAIWIWGVLGNAMAIENHGEGTEREGGNF